MKRITSIILFVSIILATLPVFPVNAATSGIYTYTIENNQATITACNTSASGNIEIPAMLGGYPVTKIGVRAFYNCVNITSVTIPDSVTLIGIQVFQNCKKIKTIILPSSITVVPNGAFYNCEALDDITLPNSIKTIGSSAFDNCRLLKNIVIPSSVETIEFSAFANCSSLESIIIPNSVTSMENHVFYNCTSLIDVTLSEHISAIDDYMFYNCTSLSSITIPENIKTIGDSAFSSCTALTNIDIPYGVTSIFDFAFGNCTALESITIPNSVTSIGDDQNAIDNGVFYGCTSLRNVILPNSITEIYEYTFYGCTSLVNVTIPISVTAIYNDAFYECPNLSLRVYTDSFAHNYVVTNHMPYTIIPQDLYTYTIENNQAIITACEKTVSGDIVVPFTLGGFPVKKIGANAFADCSFITGIIIPDNIMDIYDYAFYNCTGLTSIKLPNNLEEISSYAFAGCTSLTRLELPNTVTKIYNNAFQNCTNLLFLGIYGVNYIEGNPFTNCPKLRLGVGKYSYALEFAQNYGIPYDNPFISYTIENNCAIVTYCEYKVFSEVNIPPMLGGYPVTEIRDYVFKDCNYLKRITIPESIVSISGSAFMGCNSVETIEIKGGTRIEKYTFSLLSSNLQTVILSNSITSIGRSAFSNAPNLNKVILPNGLISIEDRAFSGCGSLTELTLPSSITYMGEDVFSNTNITLKVYPDSYALQYAIANYIPYEISYPILLTNNPTNQLNVPITSGNLNSITSVNFKISLHDKNVNHVGFIVAFYDAQNKLLSCVIYHSSLENEEISIPINSVPNNTNSMKLCAWNMSSIQPMMKAKEIQ